MLGRWQRQGYGYRFRDFAPAILFNADIRAYLGYLFAKLQLFIKLGFDLSNAYESPSKEGIYLRLQDNHYSPLLYVYMTRLMIALVIIMTVS